MSLVAEVLTETVEIEALGSAWLQLAAAHDISLEEYVETLNMEGIIGARLVVIRDCGEAIFIAPFLLQEGMKRYAIGERTLFDLPVKKLFLLGEAFLGKITEDVLQESFRALAPYREVDLISFAELPLEGKVYKYLNGPLKEMAWRCVIASHKTSLHWLIDLPASFDDYLSVFTGKKRKALRRYVRKFENDFDAKLKIVTKAEEVNDFLHAGETLCRLTYQWHIGQRLINDEHTQRELKRIANAGNLRCYLLYADGEPDAYIRGEIKGNSFFYHATGYDPKHKDYSPGTVLLMKAIEDLIAEPRCEILDFGDGGDDIGYKKRFGTRFYEVNSLDVGHKWKLYTIIMFSIQNALSSVKRLGHFVINDGIKIYLRKRLRKNSV